MSRPIACFVRSGGEIVAGAYGRTEFNRLFVTYLWVEQALRCQGLGSGLLRRIEASAAARGCTDALIETLSDETACMYRRRGYTPLATIPNYVVRLRDTYCKRQFRRMPRVIEFETDRLRLRQWREADREPFAALCADPLVMEFLTSDRDRATADTAIDKWQSRIAQNGWGFWAVELKRINAFIGFVGMQVPAEPHPFLPCVEIGWRLAAAHWGSGYATEAAKQTLRIAFEVLALQEVLASTAVGNLRSSALMERLGMYGPEAIFEHPGVPTDNPLRRHVLYRLTRKHWDQQLHNK